MNSADQRETSDAPAAKADKIAERPLTLESLATLLLRFLGVYFIAGAIVGLCNLAIHVIHASDLTSLEVALQREWFYFVRPVLEAIMGGYFLLGGQWVFEKILTPIVRQPTEDASIETR